jgi:nucleoside-diphosphate-sugar epimerase
MSGHKLKILVTGGNGFLGSAICKELYKDFNIIVLEHSFQENNRISDILSEISFYEAKGDYIKRIFKREQVDIIIHSATIYGNSNTPLKSIVESNILMPLKLIDAGKKNGLKAFINTDSFFNYSGNKYHYLESYTLSKKQLNEWLMIYASYMPIINMKLQHMYGPNDNERKFVIQMANALMRNKKQIDLTPGDQIRDFIFVTDVVNAYKIILENLQLYKKGFQSFDVGTGIGCTIKDFMKVLKSKSGANTMLNFGSIPYRQNEIMSSVADNRKLVELGWHYKTDLATGITKLLNALK